MSAALSFPTSRVHAACILLCSVSCKVCRKEWILVPSPTCIACLLCPEYPVNFWDLLSLLLCSECIEIDTLIGKYLTQFRFMRITKIDQSFWKSFSVLWLWDVMHSCSSERCKQGVKQIREPWWDHSLALDFFLQK